MAARHCRNAQLPQRHRLSLVFAIAMLCVTLAAGHMFRMPDNSVACSAGEQTLASRTKLAFAPSRSSSCWRRVEEEETGKAIGVKARVCSRFDSCHVVCCRSVGSTTRTNARRTSASTDRQQALSPQIDQTSVRSDSDSDPDGGHAINALAEIGTSERHWAQLLAPSRRARLAWLKNRLQLNDGQLKKLYHTTPSISDISIDRNMSPKVEYLQHRLSLTDKQLSKLVQKVPRVLAYSLHDNIVPKLDYLQQRLSLKDGQLKVFVIRCPTIFHFNITNNIQPKLGFLQRRLGVTDDQLKSMIRRAPNVLAMSVEDKMAVNIVWLEQLMGETPYNKGVTQSSNGNFASQTGLSTHNCTSDGAVSAIVQKVLRRAPALLCLSIERNLQPTVDSLRQHSNFSNDELQELIGKFSIILMVNVTNTVLPALDWIKTTFAMPTEGDMKALVLRRPALLTMSVESNLQPTFDFYVDCFGGNSDTARKILLQDPALFTYSLEGRLRPRLSQVATSKRCGVGVDGTDPGTGTIELSVRQVRWLAKTSEADWNAAPVHDGNAL